MFPLVVWLTLIGYTVAWTGRQNLGLGYRPQADGSVQVVDAAGRPATPWTLGDAVACRQPTASSKGIEGAASPSARAPLAPRAAEAPPPPRLPALTPAAIGARALLGDLLVPAPAPRPTPAPDPLAALERSVFQALSPLAVRLGGLLGR